MSEWIRHRGSKSMPKCLEGKRFEVRQRNGAVCELKGEPIAVRHSVTWSHCDADRENDIMAYRIIPSEPAAAPAKPDHSKGYPEGTTAKDIGAKVGDKFVMISKDHHSVSAGEILSFLLDDGTSSPFFNDSNGELHCAAWHRLAPIPQKTAIELQAEEVGIPEPVQHVDGEWIEWKGGECPVPKGTLVDVRYLNGKVKCGLPALESVSGCNAAEPYWFNDGWDYDITAYRLHQPQEWPEDRIDVIGQNGNDGLNYDAVPTNKYQRTIKGVTVDVYDVLAAFGVTCQARGHAIKKLLMAGQRGHKDEAQDLRESMQAIERSIELIGK